MGSLAYLEAERPIHDGFHLRHPLGTCGGEQVTGNNLQGLGREVHNWGATETYGEKVAYGEGRQPNMCGQQRLASSGRGENKMRKI